MAASSLPGDRVLHGERTPEALPAKIKLPDP